MIRKNNHFVFATFQILMLCLKSFDNSQKFAVVGLVLGPCKNYFPRKEKYWILLA